MTDIGILFSAPMVRALLVGHKTQTRRALKPQPDLPPKFRPPLGFSFMCPPRHYEMRGWTEEKGPLMRHRPLPYWNGDLLWVREAWRTEARFDGLPPRDVPRTARISYEADYIDEPNDGCRGRYRHARFMPRWASRLTLTVDKLRVQSLHEITEEDAIAEGAGSWSVEGERFETSPTAEVCAVFARSKYGSHRKAFEHIWDTINGMDAWEVNPFVVAVNFKVHKANIDTLARAA